MKKYGKAQAWCKENPDSKTQGERSEKITDDGVCDHQAV